VVSNIETDQSAGGINGYIYIERVILNKKIKKNLLVRVCIDIGLYSAIKINSTTENLLWKYQVTYMYKICVLYIYLHIRRISDTADELINQF